MTALAVAKALSTQRQPSTLHLQKSHATMDPDQQYLFHVHTPKESSRTTFLELPTYLVDSPVQMPPLTIFTSIPPRFETEHSIKTEGGLVFARTGLALTWLLIAFRARFPNIASPDPSRMWVIVVGVYDQCLCLRHCRASTQSSDRISVQSNEGGASLMLSCATNYFSSVSDSQHQRASSQEIADMPSEEETIVPSRVSTAFLRISKVLTVRSDRTAVRSQAPQRRLNMQLV